MVGIFLAVLILIFFARAEDVYIEAYSLEIDKNTVYIRGDVRFSFGDTIVQTNRLIFDQNTKILRLLDYFILVSNNIQVKGYEGYWNLSTNEGVLSFVEGILDNRFYIKASKLEKKADIFYIYSGEFSMCPFNQYDWYMKSSKIRLKKDDYMYAYNLRLSFFRVPVVYLPFFAYPTYNRKSGLLVPTIGQDTYNTFMFRIPIFYVINKNSDVTFTYDFRNQQGQGIDVEYRNRFSKRSLFTGEVFYFRENGEGYWWEGRDVSPLKNRWRIKANTSFRWRGWKVFFNLDLPSDHFFFEDFYSSSSLRYLAYTKSQLLAQYDGGWFTSEVNFDYLYDLTTTTNTYTLQRLPEIRFYVKQRQILKYFPIYFDFLSVNTHFYREIGDKAVRSDNQLRLKLYYHLLGFNSYFDITPRATFYLRSEGADVSVTSKNSILFEEKLRRSFVRVLNRFNHIIIPELTFSYLTKINDNEEAIFDREDNIFERKDIDFAVHNILNFKQGDDFFRWSIYTGYSFTGKYQIGEQVFNASLKAIRNNFYFKIGKWTGENNLFFDFSIKRVVRSITSFYFPFTSWFEYTMTHSFDRGDGEEQPGVNQINNKVKLRYKNFIFEGSVLNNIKDGYIQQKRLSVAIDRKCWSLKIKYIEDYNKETNKTYANFVLAIDFLDIEYAVPFLAPKLFQSGS
ncbi:MAG: LPS-assembly protein LptD [Aquificae bacterium]|nr:LPS-assembly protein LptD [Aquificota bacterium]